MAKAPKADSLLIELENAVNKINFFLEFYVRNKRFD
jgi:hypothetical protein